MKAVVMAGGEGSRLRPLTSRRPKPLAPIANKPVMHHIVELLKRHGITEIVATLHYLADEIESYFGDGSALGVAMQYVVEDTPLGTAGAVKMAEARLGGETFVIISGDAMTDLDLTSLIQAHRAAGNTATIALLRVSNPLEFGVVITDDDARITRFVEKPSWGEVFSDTINTGIYVLEPEVLAYMEAGRSYDFSKDIFPLLLRDGKRLGGHVISDYWADVGNLQQYQQANYDALAGTVRTDVLLTKLSDTVWTGADCSVDPSASIVGPVQLGDGVTIGPGAQIEGPAAIGDGAIVEAGARVYRAVVWENVYVGEDAELTDCTVAHRTIVKARATDRRRRGDRRALHHRRIRLDPSALAAVAGKKRQLGCDRVDVVDLRHQVARFVLRRCGRDRSGEFRNHAGVRTQAWASVWILPQPRRTVMTRRDTHPCSRMMNRCIISGLLSVGVNVEDLRSFPLPLSRFATRTGGDGGVHVRIAPGDPHSLLFEFLDRRASTSIKPRNARSKTCSSARISAASRWTMSASWSFRRARWKTTPRRSLPRSSPRRRQRSASASSSIMPTATRRWCCRAF